MKYQKLLLCLTGLLPLSMSQTPVPSSQPSSIPSLEPSSMPSFEPSSIPSLEPSSMPSLQPSSMPSLQPSSMPSQSSMPSLQPSEGPSNFGETNLSIDFGDGFPCSGIRLNQGPRAFPRLVDDGNDNDTCLLRLSPDRVGRAVSAFLPYRFSKLPDDTAFAFNVEFTYRIFGIENGVGDGIAFVIHQDPREEKALGDGGGNLGVYGDNIISPALVIELDTFINRFGLPADEFERAIHVTIIDDGDIFEVAEIPAGEIRNTPTDMDPIKVNINSDGDTLTIFVNDVFRLQADVNLVQHFLGRDVYVGFTGGAGASADQQDILTWTMESVEATGSTLFGPRTAETRPPIPPTPPPVPPPPRPTSSPVALTAAPSASPSSVPSSGPTTAAQRAQSFFEWFISVVRELVDVLRATEQVLESRGED